MENSPTHHPIEHNQRVIYDVELENTLNNMTTNTGFLKTYNDPERGWMGNGHPIKVLRGTEVEINDKNFNVTPNLQKVFTQTSNIPLKKLNDQEWEIYKNILETYNFEKYTPKFGENKSSRYKTSKAIFRNNLGGQGNKKIIKPSDIIDIYTRLEILQGLNLYGHTDTLSEASNLIDELYKRGEIQNEQEYQNALNKFSIIKTYSYKTVYQ